MNPSWSLLRTSCVDRGRRGFFLWRSVVALGLLSLVILMTACDKHPVKPEAVAGPLRVLILPEADTLAVDSSRVFVGYLIDVNGDSRVAGNLRWSKIGDPIGILDRWDGDSVRFTATAPGVGRLIADQAGQKDTALVWVTQHVASVIGIRVRPEADTLEVGASKDFEALAICDNGDTLPAPSVSWSLVGDPIGMLSHRASGAVRFAATGVGAGRLIATSGAFNDAALLKVVVASPYYAFPIDSTVGSVGIFALGPDTNEVILSSVFDNTSPSGGYVLKVDFTIGEYGWAGLFVQLGPFGGTGTVDLSHFLPSGHLRLSIRSTYDVQVGIRSSNIPSDQSHASRWIQGNGYADMDGTWKTVSIPLTAFGQSDVRLDFSRIQVLFSAGLTAQQFGYHSTSGTFWIDQVWWTKD